MTELICIVCPKGCHLKVDEENGFSVTGNSCPHGAEYGRKELTNPTRVITSTVCVEGGTLRRASGKPSSDIPKGKIVETTRLLDAVNIPAPVAIGDWVAKAILQPGVAFTPP